MAPNFIDMAVPVFFLLIGVELLVSWFARRANYRFNDSINDLSLGIIDQVGGAFLKSFVFVGYLYLYHHHRLFDIPNNSVLAWIACFLLYDLAYYWAHRASHEINIVWASHIPHHQSEEYNLSVALRQGLFQGCLFWIFYLPLGYIGFSPLLFIACAQLDTIYQFGIHTRTIGKLGPLEWFMNTPSHHRVHHGKNPKYIDKNHGGVLIIWDRLFGTFQAEEEEPLYGTATPLRSWNPVWANVHYWIDLARLAWNAPRTRDKFLVWFMKPAWRPEGLEKQGPPASETREFYLKYDPKVPVGVSMYAFAQFLPTLVIGIFFMKNERAMEWTERAGVAGLVIMTLVCIGGLLEGKRWAFLVELLRLPVFATACVIWCSRFFGLDTASGLALAIASVVTIAVLLAWVFAHRRVFTRPFGAIENNYYTTTPVEQKRLPDPSSTESPLVSAK
ncbi:MAG: sterol desaturase family protein [Candidatus Hydrogenedentes bacterium]|nr:sterol desaturase family protein [Candidatus Hydrogenedentota bacterium]